MLARWLRRSIGNAASDRAFRGHWLCAAGTFGD